MSPASIQTPAFIFYCSPVQGTMAGSSTKFDSMVRGQHVYKSAWTSLTDKMRKCILYEGNECDKYAVSNIQKEDAHIKRDIKSKLIFVNAWYHFKFNNFGTWCLNRPMYLFHSLCSTTWHTFKPLLVYELGFSMDNHSTYIQ